MPNPLRGESSFEAGGTVFTLRWDVNVICEAEDALDMPVDEILARYFAGPSTTLLRGLVWAALQPSHTCSIEDAGNIISDASYLVAKQALEKAITNAMPEATEEENPPKRGRAGTGSSSSKRGRKPASIPTPSGDKHPA